MHTTGSIEWLDHQEKGPVTLPTLSGGYKQSTGSAGMTVGKRAQLNLKKLVVIGLRG